MTLLILPRKTLNFNGVLGLEGRIQCCGKRKQTKSNQSQKTPAVCIQLQAPSGNASWSS